jgi:hypothetical protein
MILDDFPKESRVCFGKREEENDGTHSAYYFDHSAYRQSAYLASQFGLGILSQRRTRNDPSHLDHPVAAAGDLK